MDSQIVKKKLTKNNVYINEQKQIFDKVIQILDLIPDDSNSTIRKDIIKTNILKLKYFLKKLKFIVTQM